MKTFSIVCLADFGVVKVLNFNRHIFSVQLMIHCLLVVNDVRNHNLSAILYGFVRARLATHEKHNGSMVSVCVCVVHVVYSLETRY